MEEKIVKNKSTTSHSKRSHRHSHHRRHRSSRHRKTNRFWYWFTKPFRKQQRVSGVRAGQQKAEKRTLIFFTLSAVVLLCLMIPFFTWLAELIYTHAEV